MDFQGWTIHVPSVYHKYIARNISHDDETKLDVRS